MLATLHTSGKDPTDQSANDELATVSPDLGVELLHDVVHAAYDPNVTTISPFAPFGAKNTELQIRATEYLRERLSSLGWEVSNAEQIPSIISRSDSIRIVCSTDGGPNVGIEGQQPILRKKGKGTVRIAGHSAIYAPTLPGFEEPGDDTQPFDELEFYYLLMHIDENRGEIRLELSQPILNSDGTTELWQNRIILPAIDISPEPLVETVPTPAPEINVVRKIS